MPACPERHRAPSGLRARASCRASSEGQEGTVHYGESSDWGSRVASWRLPVASSVLSRKYRRVSARNVICEEGLPDGSADQAFVIVRGRFGASGSPSWVRRCNPGQNQARPRRPRQGPSGMIASRQLRVRRLGMNAGQQQHRDKNECSRR